MVSTLLISTVLTIIIGMFTVKTLNERKIKQVERLDGPQSHLKKAGTPTMGGVMIIISTILISIVYIIIKNEGIMQNLPVFLSLFVGTLVIGAIGFLDDFLKVEVQNTKGLKPKLKMLALILVSAILMYVLIFRQGISTDIRIFKGNSIKTARVVKLLLGMLVIMATSNSVNLTDGIDGLASSVGLIILTFLASFALSVGNTVVATYLAIVIGGYIAFLLFNWHPAKVFMGDTGSFFLGGVIAIASILLNLELFLILIAIIPVLEAISVIIQVAYFKKTGKRVFKMAPIHHHFEQCGWSELKVVGVFSGITLAACILSRILL